MGVASEGGLGEKNARLLKICEFNKVVVAVILARMIIHILLTRLLSLENI